jgi:hypothetical protein
MGETPMLPPRAWQLRFRYALAMRRRFIFLSVVCISAIFTRHCFAEDKTYKVVIHRDVAVGQWFQLNVSGTVKRVYTWKDPAQKQPDPEQFAGEIDAVERVLAVEPNSHSACKVEFTIKSLARDKVELVAAGSVIVGECLAGDSHFTMGGQNVDPQMQDMLDQLLIDLQPANDPHTVDEAIGIDKPIKVGDTWQCHRAKDAANWSSAHCKVAEADITGNLKLESVEAAPPGEMLHIKSTTRISNVSSDWDDGRKLDRGTIASEIEFIVPSDTSSQRSALNETMHTDLDFTVKSPDGTVDLLNMKMDLARKILEVPLGPAAAKDVK